MQYIPYVIVSLIAILFGQIVSHINKKLPPVVCEEITYKEFFKKFTKDFKIDIKYTVIFLILYNSFVYFAGNTVSTYLYTLVTASLAIVFSVDYRFQLIPDECHVIIVFAGLINLLLNLNMWWSYLIGAAIGGGIFWGLGLMSLLILKKEGMGFGDVKLMAAIGFLFGIKYILVITLVSFLLGAIVGGTLIIIRKKDTNSYIPFGPFIVIATILLIFVPADYIIELYIAFCSYLGTKMSDIVYFFISK
jgi:leader peptidase (prepilin peptidase)/N-methyltransferase